MIPRDFLFDLKNRCYRQSFGPDLFGHAMLPEPFTAINIGPFVSSTGFL
jgi:hypothetical protein